MTACFDVAIILGARIEPDGRPSPAMERRVRLGVKLLAEGRTRALLMSGGLTTHDTAEACTMRDLALALGAPPQTVHVEPHARNTIENARFSAPILAAQGWRRAVVVTDSFHLPRSWYIFRRHGLKVALMGARPDKPGREWWLAHVRELAAIPWTILRVEWAKRPGRSGAEARNQFR